jgi:hypothetical protein
MLIINHRVNTLEKLKSTPISYGVEVDIKEKDGRLYTGHDPYDKDAGFEEWASLYRHRFAAINIKQEGIEAEVLEILKKNNIVDFFLFDLSFPMLKKLSDRGENRLAIRVSDLEGFAHVMHFQGKVNWVWLDAFSNLMFLEEALTALSKFKICAVSPELHVERSAEDVNRINNQLILKKGNMNAICTKLPQFWSSEN